LFTTIYITSIDKIKYAICINIYNEQNKDNKHIINDTSFIQGVLWGQLKAVLQKSSHPYRTRIIFERIKKESRAWALIFCLRGFVNLLWHTLKSHTLLNLMYEVRCQQIDCYCTVNDNRLPYLLNKSCFLHISHSSTNNTKTIHTMNQRHHAIMHHSFQLTDSWARCSLHG
jgi:hypothetical protein